MLTSIILSMHLIRVLRRGRSTEITTFESRCRLLLQIHEWDNIHRTSRKRLRRELELGNVRIVPRQSIRRHLCTLPFVPLHLPSRVASANVCPPARWLDMTACPGSVGTTVTTQLCRAVAAATQFVDLICRMLIFVRYFGSTLLRWLPHPCRERRNTSTREKQPRHERCVSESLWGKCM